MEMFFWHNCHWVLWNNWDLLGRSVNVYFRFLPTSIERAQSQEGLQTRCTMVQDDGPHRPLGAW